MNRESCRICLQPLDGPGIYHEGCCKKLFGAPHPPSLPYSWDQINELAEKTVRNHVAVPGVQPKLSVHLERGGARKGGRFTLVGMDGGYILKPPVESYPEMPELEHLTMCMARDFGIKTAECGLIPLEDGRLSFITRRMDREGSSKIHMEDMCQLTDRLTEQKYRASMEQAGKAILKYCTNPVYDVLRFFETTLFCFLTGNADMHLKNFSLLYRPGGEVTLSPAYDLLPTVLLLPEDTEEAALTVNGKKRRLDRMDFVKFGNSLKLNEKQIENAFERARNSMSAVLDTLTRGLCAPETRQKFKALIEERGSRIE